MNVPGLTISELYQRQVLVLTIDDEVTPELRSLALDAALAAVRRCTKYIVADFSCTTRLGSAMPGLLAYYSTCFQKQGIKLLAVKGSAPVMRLLALSGADRIIPFFDTLRDVLEQVRLSQVPNASP